MIQDVTIQSQNGVIYHEAKIRANENQYLYLSAGDVIIKETQRYKIIRKQYDIEGKAIQIIVRRDR